MSLRRKTFLSSVTRLTFVTRIRALKRKSNRSLDLLRLSVTVTQSCGNNNNNKSQIRHFLKGKMNKATLGSFVGFNGNRMNPCACATKFRKVEAKGRDDDGVRSMNNRHCQQEQRVTEVERWTLRPKATKSGGGSLLSESE